MTLKYFRKLSESQQYRRLLVDGTHIADRTGLRSMILLFQLEGYYIEVYFHHDTDELLGSRSFSGTDELQPYLQQIDLAGLLG